MQNKHSERAGRALRALCDRDPSYSSLVLWCEHRDCEPVQIGMIKNPPAFTDGLTIYYGPRFEEFSLDEQVAVVAHEVWHVSLRHISRMQYLHERAVIRMHPLLANILQDGIINEALRLAGFKLPDGMIYLVDLFADIFQEKVKAKDVLAKWDFERLYLHVMRETEGGRGGQGGRYSDLIDAIESWADGRGFETDVDYTSTRETPTEAAQNDRAWKGRAEQAMAYGKSFGTGIGALGFTLADLEVSSNPWEPHFRGLASRALKRDSQINWARPRRSWIARESDHRRRGLPVPAYEPRRNRDKSVPRIVVAIDASTSITEAELGVLAGETAAIIQQSGAEVHVMVFDTQVHRCEKIEGYDVKKEILGIDFCRGGGTSFVEPVEAAAELNPSLLIVLTDLMGPFGDPVRFPVIWASTTGASRSVPFGDVIDLSR